MTRCIRGKMQETGVVTVAPGVSAVARHWRPGTESKLWPFALHGIPRLSHPVISCHSSSCTITQNISPCTAGLNIPTSYKPSESADILYISVKVSFYSLCHNPGLNLTSASSQPFFILFIILFKGMNKKKKEERKKKGRNSNIPALVDKKQFLRVRPSLASAGFPWTSHSEIWNTTYFTAEFEKHQERNIGIRLCYS